ncbi:MAG: PilX N-terminal domain-containing pilus assembly protein [Thermoanaerobaculaceae bacterium]|nr:PilX N-terminal domain-containing pilus assembly protein [Thermoanaerobaculaceae bacterium]
MQRSRSREQGVALLTVVLILLVLTVLGMTATMMMTQEDRLSSRQEMLKEAFYAAEAGLRQGETICTHTEFTAARLTGLLRQTFTPMPSCPATNPSTPVHPAVGRDSRNWTIQALGNYLADGAPIVNHEVELASLAGVGRTRRAYYTLYIRNNPEDMGNTVVPPMNQDPDNKLRLVSVGFITDGDGVNPTTYAANILAVRVLEEELQWRTGVADAGSQVIKNSGGTGSGLIDGTDLGVIGDTGGGTWTGGTGS